MVTRALCQPGPSTAGPLSLLGLLVLVVTLGGCAGAGSGEPGSAGSVEEGEEAQPSTEEAPAVETPAPWVQFGMVLDVRESRVRTPEGDNEAGMAMTILMDSGERLQVVQAYSQAGRLEEGDRVRVVRIGEFTQVTFWPYGELYAPSGRQDNY